MQNCSRCTFKKWLKPAEEEDRYAWSHGHRVRQWICGRCGNLQAEEPPHIALEPRILYVDIETSLIKAFSWGLRVPSRHINPALLVTDFFVICWSASWVGDRAVYSGFVTGTQAKKGNDKQCLRVLWGLVDEADVLAGHNVKAFDEKKLNTRFMLNGYEKPRTYRFLDTLAIAKKHFAFQSNSLEHISMRLGFHAKDDMSLDDWIRVCVDGDEQRIEKMSKYCANDVRQGKRVLEKLLPWVTVFPARPRGGYKTISERI